MGLKSSCTNNHHTHNNNVYDVSCNYFERGKDSNDLHDSSNNPLHAPKLTKLHQSNSYVVKFASIACNYYERGGNRCPLYVTNYMLHSPTDNMHLSTSIFCHSLIYKMPMHRKKVRLHCHCFHILCCFLPCFDLTIILIGMSTPWDPGI